MSRISRVCLASTALFTLFGCVNAQQMPKEVVVAFHKAEVVELISIDPSSRQAKGTYYYWKELGRTKINSASVRKTIVANLNDAINKSDGTVAACFNPRHAVQAVYNEKKYEVIICFECLSLEVRIDGKETESHTITRTHSEFFNKLLTDAKLPIAE